MTQRDEDLASEMIAARLQDPGFQDRLATGRSRTEFLDDELSRDLVEMNDIQLRAKYGPKVQGQAWRIGQGASRLRDSDQSERTGGEVISDTAVSAATALYRDVGNLGVLAAGYVEGTFDPKTTGAARAAELSAAHNKIVTGMLSENLSEDLQDKQYFSEVEGVIDRENNEFRFREEMAAGANPTMAELRREGRNAMDAFDRYTNQPELAGNLIAEGIGSLFASAPLAGAGGLAAKGASQLVVRNTLAQRVAQATGVSAAAGTTEVGGVYAEAVSDVMAIPTKRLAETSSVFNSLVQEGMTPEEARVQLAGMTAETAAVRQIPATLALGFITSRFEAMPIGSFRGIGIAKGLLSIAGEGIEEAGQGISGTVNRNLSVEEFAQIGRGTLDGVGEEAAIGALAGMGTAGVAAGPATVRGAGVGTIDSARSAANALFSETTFNDPLRQDILGGSRVSRGVDAVAPGVRAGVQATTQVASTVAETVRPVTDVVLDTLDRVNTRDERAQTRGEVAEAVEAAREVDEEISAGALTPEVEAKVANVEAQRQVSDAFRGDVDGNAISTTAKVMAKVANPRVKLTQEDKAFAAAQITTLKGLANSLPAKARRQVLKMVTSKAAQTVQSEATNLDLNKEEISPQAEVSTTVNVAKTNPANVKPESVKKILEESGRDISEEDAKYLRVASRIAETVNNAVGQIVSLRQEENIGLAKAERTEKENLNPDSVSRIILAKGFTTSEGKPLRSVNDFASDIIQGLQSPDGTIINQRKQVVPVKTVVQQFGMFIEHMNNRVEALNRSWDNNTLNAKGQLTANGQETYRTLKDGERWIEAGATGSGSIFVHRSNPSSVATAKRVAQDRDTAAAIYQALSEEFPDLFNDIEIPELVTLKANENQSEQPTGIDEEFAAANSEEQNQTNNERQARFYKAAELFKFLTENQNEDPWNNKKYSNEVTFVEEYLKEILGNWDRIANLVRQADLTDSDISVANDNLFEFHLNEEVQWPFDSFEDFKNAVQIDPNQPDLFSDQEQPAGIDDVSESTSEEVTEEASADEGTDEGVELRTEEISDEDAELKTLLDSPDLWTSEDRTRLAEIHNDIRKVARDALQEFYGDMAKRVRDLRIYPEGLIDGPGFAFVNNGEQTIYLSEEVVKNGELTPLGKAVIIHEMAHVIDFTNPRYGDIDAWISERHTFDRDGAAYREFLFLASHSKWVKKRTDYANSFKGDDEVQFRAEMFAVLTEFYFSKDSSILENSPAILELMEEVYGPRERAEATGIATEEQPDEAVSEEPTGTAEEAGDETPATETESSAARVKARVNKIYADDPESGAPVSVAELQQQAENDGGLNMKIIEFTRAFAPVILNQLNKRLDLKKEGGINGNPKKLTPREHVAEGTGIEDIQRYRLTALVDPVTGEFDQNLVELATVALVDWMATATPSDPGRISDTLEKQGLSFSDIDDAELRTMALGIPPSTLKPQLANAILRMWGMKSEKTNSMGSVYGMAEGLAAEMLLAMSDNYDYFKIERVTLTTVQTSDAESGTKEIQKNKTDTILLNMNHVRAMQAQIREDRKDGVADTAKSYLFNEAREQYVINAPVSKKSRKGLSRLEAKAIQKMEETPHYMNEELESLFFDVLGEDNLKILFGHQTDINEETVPNGTLRRSILGKNLSVENNLADAALLTRQLVGSDAVRYPVDVTSVGRHQYEGVNPQNNKILRALVTPTWTTVDIAQDEDSVWLGVAQAADLHKIEKKNHVKILETVRDDFLERYGEAYNQALNHLRGEPVDANTMRDSFLGSETEIEPQVIAAVFTVAKMQHAKDTGQTSFESSLSVELDGLTNGAANMMVNFAQGLMTDHQWENFKRIGFVIGKTGETINKFFENPNNLDMYETVARLAQEKLVKGLRGKNGNEYAAIQRIAGHFGDLKINEKTGQAEMTRNSAKNPMTKVNYGSGILGVGTGLADEMLINLYAALHGTKLSEIPYAGDIVKDFATMGINIPTDPTASWEASPAQVKAFRENVANTLGSVLTEAAKETLGDKIIEVNDMLVFSTNIQAAYLNEVFFNRIETRAKELAAEGKMEKNKDGSPKMTDFPVEEYDRVVNELQSLSPIFTSDEQTLEIGGFKTKIARDWSVLSSTMDNRLNQKPMLKQPDDVGVKAIPFTVIGTGDAMMMNLIFGQDNAPVDVLGIFDGLDVPVTKVQQYAPMVNQKVMQSWDRDVLAMAVENYRGFLAQDLDEDVLKRAFMTAKEKSKKSTVTATNTAELMEQFDNRLEANRAFKAALKKLPLSVDQMGGSDVGYSRGKGTFGLNAINDIIRREIEGRPVESAEAIDEVDVKEPVFETTVEAAIKGVRWSEQQKKVMTIIQPMLKDKRVVYGTIDQLNAWRRENLPDDGLVMDAPAQYDPENEILFMSVSRSETLLHELVHAATFEQVLDHYNGQTNDAVTRLEGLMDDFLAITDGDPKVREAQATILTYKAVNEPFAKAAAVNEMMAYVLANTAVRKKTKATQAKSLAAWGSKVIRLMRRLLGGAPESIFDGVAFNTQVLNSVPVEDGDNGGNGNGDGGDTGNVDSTPPANNYTNYWIKLMSDYLNEGNFIQQAIRTDEQVPVRRAANSIADGLRQEGILRNREAMATFKAIFSVMNAQISLQSQSVISLAKTFEHVVENMTPEMFGDGDQAEREFQAVAAAFTDPRTEDRKLVYPLASFLALSQTSAKFRAVLAQIPEPGIPDSTGSNKLETVLNTIVGHGMSTITATLNDNGNPQDVVDNLAAMIVDHDVEREYKLLKHVTGALTFANSYVSGKMQQVAEFMRRTDRETKELSRSETRKFLTTAVTLGTNYLDKSGTDLSNDLVKNKFHSGIPLLSLAPVRELVSEMVGTDRFNQNVVALQDKVNHAIAGMRQAFREDLPAILNRQFSEPLSNEQWKTMFRGLAKTDISAIVDVNNIGATMNLLSDPGVRAQKIRTLETQLDQKLVPYVAQDAKDKAEQLANFMIGGGVGVLLIRNSYAIAKALDGEFDADLVPIIDQLVSHYAVDMMDQDARQEIVDFYATDPDAVEGVVTYLKYLNDQEDAKSVGDIAKMNGYKGYIPNEGAQDARVIIADDSDELALKTKGYVKAAPYEGDPGQLIDRSYYVTETRASGQYAQGTLQNVASTYRGVDVNTGLSLTGDTTGYISGDGVVERWMEQLLDPTYRPTNPREGLVPVFAEDGAVSGFERALDPEIIDQHMGRKENLAIMMGAWAGRQIEETLATQYNEQLIDELDRIWSTREHGTDNLFVNIKDSDDPIYAESFRLIPQGIKSYIDTKFDGEGMMVRKDMVNLSVGYREASLADMWSGKTRMPKDVQKAVTGVTQLFMGRNAMKRVVQAETILQGAVSTAKDIIVIRSLVVPALNMQANVAQLATNGVPVKTMVKDFRRKLAEIEKYSENVTRIIDLNAKIHLTANANQKRILRDKIQVIEDLNKKMSIAPMIEAGAYKQLSEGITDFDRDMTSGKLGDFIEGLVSKLPSGVRTVGEYGIVSKSTKVYKAANRATQYGDFLAKSILYDHLLSKGLDPESAVAAINEEFVNFTTQPGRVRSALERNGLSWFMSFKLRITKIAMKQMRDNPVRAIAINFALDVGSPIADNIFSVIADGRLDYATGYEMLFVAPELNPWVNLLSD